MAVESAMKWSVLSAWRGLKSKFMRFSSGASRSPALTQSKTPRHLLLGKKGERLAVSYLRRKHHRILARNFTTKLGEIDIVSRRGGTIVFTEVKSSVRAVGFAPRDRVSISKRRKLEQLSLIFLQRMRLGDPPVRFDIIEVNFKHEKDPKPEIVHLPAAF